MKALKFTLKGKNAFFKKPEVNTYYYFTYGNIHKPALLGLFGAIMGYGGYSQMEKGDLYPEYYAKLRDLRISVIPCGNNGHFSRKIQRFNNSVGYASYEQGGNLIIKEQWLEDPQWNIYILVDCAEAERLADAILNDRCVYVPYLGKNDHPADILNSSMIEVEAVSEMKGRIDSLMPKSWVTLDLEDDDEEVENEFKYEEFLPWTLDEELNLYQSERFIYSNYHVAAAKCEIWIAEGKKIIFY